MHEFLKQRWNYWKDAEGTFTINAIEPEMLIARTFGEEGAISEAEDEAIAKAISELPEICMLLSNVGATIRDILPKIPDTVDTYDLLVEADLIDDMLTIIGAKEAQS